MNKKELGALIIDGTDDFYRVAKSILKEDADCQDAVQEAVSKAFAKIDTLREKKYAKTWFIRILLNECYRMLRQRKREAAYHEQISGEEIRQHQYSDLYQKIMSLEIEYRVPLVLSESIYNQGNRSDAGLGGQCSKNASEPGQENDAAYV